MLYKGAIRYLTIRFLKENSRGISYKSWGEDPCVWYVPSSSLWAAAAHNQLGLWQVQEPPCLSNALGRGFPVFSTCVSTSQTAAQWWEQCWSVLAEFSVLDPAPHAVYAFCPLRLSYRLLPREKENNGSGPKGGNEDENYQWDFFLKSFLFTGLQTYVFLVVFYLHLPLW